MSPAKKKKATPKKSAAKKTTSKKKSTARKASTPPFDPEAPAQPGSGLFGLRTTAKLARVHVLPVPWEATVSSGKGTAKAPKEVLEASKQLDLFDADTGRPYEAGIQLLPQSATIRRLSEETTALVTRARRTPTPKLLERIDRAGARLNAFVKRTAEKSLSADKIVGVLGGDHSVSFGLIEALAARHDAFGILHIDAHHDLRRAYEGFRWSHASIMHNVAESIPQVERIVQVGVRDFCESEQRYVEDSDRRIIAHYDQEMRRATFEGVSFRNVVHAIVQQLPDKVYVSLDVDGLDPKLCPHTGTPVPGGLDFSELVHLLAEVVHSGRTLIGFDVVEVGASRDRWDANVAARLLYKLIGFALASR
ncbi:MAG TPA: agmatinase family protein [Planctomycetes bacterium]|nr:agmatinase family protein [Planctomycetota bacterium]